MRRFEDGSRKITKISEIWATPESDIDFEYRIKDLWEWIVDYNHPDKGYFKK